ncbi:MAG TPA: hypothetical protein P5307_19905 [Pirellulaceae bacterium]|nr:hypothetical protein [Planctomycetales bacterium]MCB9940262.1 hypothetical protein [Planctomycetaceae bacterium]HRX81349.1 hypothetical protein [Pirellulaceae bacterium]
MSLSPHEGHANLQDPLKPIDVPVFSCIVYVSKNSSGGVHARVANLAELELDAGTEREALSKLVPSFKQRVAELTGSKTPIPWIEPPLAKAADEQVRLIPVHL